MPTQAEMAAAWMARKDIDGERARAKAAEARVAELEAAIKEARHYLGLAKCGDPNCGGCRHDHEQAWDVLHAALKGDTHTDDALLAGPNKGQEKGNDLDH